MGRALRKGRARVFLAPPPPARRATGEFEVLSRIGRGGMGVVYRAWQPSLSRQVALKCLLGSGDPRTEARFAREIRALGRVDHPNLVKVYSSGSEGDQWFYAMELIEGADVASVLEHLASTSSGEVGESEWERALSTACVEAKRKEESVGSSDPAKALVSSAEPPLLPTPRTRPTARGHIEQVIAIARQAAEAAHALHEAGVVHRDIKPGNIMLTSDGEHAVLMDLGVAQLADEAEGRLTRTRQFVGTLRYASPEQVLAAGNLDRAGGVLSQGGCHSPRARRMRSMTSSWAGEEIAARTFICFPQEGQSVGSSSQTLRMRRAQFRLRARTNAGRGVQVRNCEVPGQA